MGSASQVVLLGSIASGGGRLKVTNLPKPFWPERGNPKLLTAEYRIAKRPAGRVLVDYNQNAWGRTLASVYSVRPTPAATVSTPVTREEVEAGIRIEDFRLDNVSARVRATGDLWRPLLWHRGRVDLERFF